MTWQKADRKTSSNWSAPKSQFAASTFSSKQPEVQKSPFAPRPFAPVEQKITPEDIAANEFQENKFEATRLKIQAKHDTITPSGQERLNLLQAKMDSYWVQRKEITQRRPGSNFANLSAAPSEPIQAKLTVGAPGDKYEQEADAMASQVMSMPDSAVQREIAPGETDEEVQAKPLAVGITPLVQRETMPEEEEVQTKPLGNGTIQREATLEEEELQTKPLNTSIQRDVLPEEEVQTKPSIQRATDGSFQAGGNIENQLNSSKGGGSPLGDEVRGFMEPRFGHDFSKVRVHTGGDSVQMNRELGAQAFAHGSDIYFGAGKSPGNNELTAHELTHVVQQTEGVNTLTTDSKVLGKGKLQTKCDECQEENTSISLKAINESTNLAANSSLIRMHSSESVVQMKRIALPKGMPLCGSNLTHVDIEPPRDRPLEPCLPQSILVKRLNIVGRQVSSSTTGKGKIIFNLHIGYYRDPGTGRLCAIVDDSKECIAPRCKTLGCFPTFKEVVEAIIAFLSAVLASKLLLDIIEGLIVVAAIA